MEQIDAPEKAVAPTKEPHVISQQAGLSHMRSVWQGPPQQTAPPRMNAATMTDVNKTSADMNTNAETTVKDTGCDPESQIPKEEQSTNATDEGRNTTSNRTEKEQVTCANNNPMTIATQTESQTANASTQGEQYKFDWIESLHEGASHVDIRVLKDFAQRLRLALLLRACSTVMRIMDAMLMHNHMGKI